MSFSSLLLPLHQTLDNICGLFAAMLQAKILICLWANCDFYPFALRQKSSQIFVYCLVQGQCKLYYDKIILCKKRKIIQL